MPSLLQIPFTDHLKPMVLVSLNAGMRRGELFDLKWSSVNFQTKTITAVGATTKTSDTRHIPSSIGCLGLPRVTAVNARARSVQI
ncbi:tyrosine-type recombinase/integrase [Pseudomonas botevensis]|uniref:tyrosine-type recombinase/integrase n=1 Tax=Pseudomonas botevensis TaxID=2842352 RepID=UPI00298F5CF9|nr:tyrosine-type recombinase/integrase [Pseudomonas botevensis]